LESAFGSALESAIGSAFGSAIGIAFGSAIGSAWLKHVSELVLERVVDGKFLSVLEFFFDITDTFSFLGEYLEVYGDFRYPGHIQDLWEDYLEAYWSFFNITDTIRILKCIVKHVPEARCCIPAVYCGLRNNMLLLHPGGYCDLRY
jgi:hypothetical protein